MGESGINDSASAMSALESAREKVEQRYKEALRMALDMREELEEYRQDAEEWLQVVGAIDSTLTFLRRVRD